ncbi:MAG: WxL domain-containing protein [Schleiferilactobacillus harbinensis]|jgi:hypothetical protein|nr:WxL domain-containing protein [Schleiferilactobacillus harbinensis]
MKRMYVTLAATALVGLGALVPVSTAHAETGPGTAGYNLSANTSVVEGQNVFSPSGTGSAATPASAKSTAEFTVQSGPLQLVAVPDLNFGRVELNKVLNGGTQELMNNTVATDGTIATSKNITAFDGNNVGALIVNDLRGTGGGWKLSTTLSDKFTSKTTSPSTAPDLVGIKLNLTSNGQNQVDGTAMVLNGSAIGPTAIQVAEAVSGKGKGATGWVLNTAASASLTLPIQQNIDVPNDAVYQADITWTLAAGA